MLLTDVAGYPRIYSKAGSRPPSYIVMTPESRPWYVGEGGWRPDATNVSVGPSTLYRSEPELLLARDKFVQVELTAQHALAMQAWGTEEWSKCNATRRLS